MNLEVTSHCDGATEIKLSKAVLIYEESVGRKAVATIHDIEIDEDGRPVIKPGVGMSLSALQEMVLALAKSEKRVSLLSTNILAFSMNHLAWWHPACVRPIYFKEHKTLKKLDGKCVTHPPLLFVATPGSLSVFALPANKRPGETTKLRFAPYLNIYEGGKMCAGNTRLPGFLTPEAIPAFEAAFYDSNFTHTNFNDKAIVRHPKGIFGYWKSRAGKRVKGLDNPSLVPLKLTVRTAIEKAIP